MHPAEHRVGHYNQRDSLFQHVDGPQHIKIAEKIADEWRGNLQQPSAGSGIKRRCSSTFAF
jgi:hypothetical protein